MHVLVNGVSLFFDVEGAKLVPDGPALRERPTLLLLHGGPGFDHSIFKPAYSALADVAQVICLDHRGNGRSEAGPRGGWTLAQWGDDVHAFCDVLGIRKPIVLGVSFGGRGRGGNPSRPARGAVRALRRRGSRRPGAPPVHRG
jgi:pimeloyl-ACP methyl ester carboxylesterase